MRRYLRTVPGGYLLAVAAGELDAEAFEVRLKDGHRALEANEPERAAELLTDALGLWRGPPLAELDFADFAQTEIRRLEELRRTALEMRAEAQLQLGDEARLVGELEALVSAHPTRERLVGLSMLALYRCGRQTEALEAYRDARRELVEDVGVEPGPQLRRLHEAILQHDPSLEPEPRPYRTNWTSPGRRRSWAVTASWPGFGSVGRGPGQVPGRLSRCSDRSASARADW
jgi:DNA-binding SARP family transcriptional activator